MIAGLVLAAGAGRRFGRPKALAVLDGERLVDRAVRVLGEGGIEDVYVVSGAAPLELSTAHVVPNPDWESGMASSLRAGLAALPADAAAVLVVPVDQPGLTPAAVRRVVGAAGPDPGTALVLATYDGVGGHPVLLGREHWAAAATSATGDRGARVFLASNEGTMVRVACEDVASGHDVDEPADLAAVRVTDRFPPRAGRRR